MVIWGIFGQKKAQNDLATLECGNLEHVQIDSDLNSIPICFFS